MLSELEALGFVPVVRLVVRNGRLKPEHLNWDDRSGWLYAFVEGNDVKYIGKTINILSMRLDAYSYGGDQGKRIRTWALDVLANGGELWLYGLRIQDWEFMDREEMRLIRHCRPPWNRQF